MRGKWTSFDPETTNAELLTIRQPDRGALYYAMERYGLGQPIGWTVKDYGDDLFMLKAKGERQGRCLFFTYDKDEPASLVALMFYKKEGNDAPDSVVKAARERRGQYIERRKKE